MVAGGATFIGKDPNTWLASPQLRQPRKSGAKLAFGSPGADKGGC